MSLSIDTYEREATGVVRVVGEVDVSNAAELREVLQKTLAEGTGGLEVDLAEVSYIDSTGIGVLVGAARRFADAGRPFRVLSPQRNVARVLSMLGVAEELGIRP